MAKSENKANEQATILALQEAGAVLWQSIINTSGRPLHKLDLPLTGIETAVTKLRELGYASRRPRNNNDDNIILFSDGQEVGFTFPISNVGKDGKETGQPHCGVVYLVGQ